MVSKKVKVHVLKSALAGAIKVLDVAESVLSTTPIPGAAAVIKVVLDLLKRKEVCMH